VDKREHVTGAEGSPSQMSESDREAVVNGLAEEMTELFHGYTSGDVSFEELTFEMYDTLQTLYAIASGDVSIEFEYEDDDDGSEPHSNGKRRTERHSGGNRP
jgi:hypothetical protein